MIEVNDFASFTVRTFLTGFHKLDGVYVYSIFTYITGETTLKEGIDVNAAPQDKALVEREKELLDKFKVWIMMKFELN